MILDCVMALAALLATGIEAAYLPTDDGGGDYLVRVEPDLVSGGSPYQFTSDVPADSRDVRRVRIYVADAWPPAVERSVIEAAKRPRRVTPVAVASARPAEAAAGAAVVGAEKPWGWLIGSLIALFLSLGANAYLGMLLGNMRQRYLRDVQQVLVRA
ncbi:MAG: hypothetical protein EBX35_13510 [Planctomycetia bacterium]|nr:hypothetical protein [Planctomycetia bacterium]